jgi:hypothetical protein
MGEKKSDVVHAETAIHATSMVDDTSDHSERNGCNHIEKERGNCDKGIEGYRLPVGS